MKSFYGTIFPVDLKPITTREFDWTIGMDWLSFNHGHILCDEKDLVIKAPNGSQIKVQGEKRCERIHVISMEKVWKGINNGETL